MADNNKTLMILTWFSVTITPQLVMAVAACNVNYVNVYIIAYRVHVYTRASLIHSPYPNPDLSNRISPKSTTLASLKLRKISPRHTGRR